MTTAGEHYQAAEAAIQEARELGESLVDGDWQSDQVLIINSAITGTLVGALTHAVLALRPGPSERFVFIDPPPVLYVDTDGDLWTEHDGAMWHLDPESVRWERSSDLVTPTDVASKYGGRAIAWPGDQS